MENQVRRLHLERLSREDWVLGTLAVLVILDLLVLPWFSFGATISVGSATVSIGGSLTAVDAPDAFLGVLALLSCAFLVADLGFERLSPQTAAARRSRPTARRPDTSSPASRRA